MTRRTKKRPAPKVMVVDPELVRARQIVRVVRASGFRAELCLSPRRALARMKREVPAAVVIEIVMAGVSGFEIAARMQADARLSRIPILFTSDISADKANHDYFPRPLDKSAFAAVLRMRVAGDVRNE